MISIYFLSQNYSVFWTRLKSYFSFDMNKEEIFYCKFQQTHFFVRFLRKICQCTVIRSVTPYVLRIIFWIMYLLSLYCLDAKNRHFQHFPWWYSILQEVKKNPFKIQWDKNEALPSTSWNIKPLPNENC